MPTVGCSDCGKQSIGTFDIVYSHKDSSGGEIQDSITRQRPLCQSCATARGVAPPPAPAAPAAAAAASSSAPTTSPK